MSTAKNASYHILRVGTAITFLWIGVLILKEPALWGAYIQSWAADFMPFSASKIMLTTALLDLFIGALLLIDYKTWLAGALGSLHLALVMTVSGINAITVRDIGLLAATLALLVSSLPPDYLKKLKNLKKR